VDWIKAAFLFPLFRNQAARGTRPQEPWAFSAQALDIIRRFVRLRYTWMPYLYNLFIEHELRGEAILRPLFYDFADTPELPLGRIDDQFMVGPSIMQAPFLTERAATRTVVLPQARWLRADTGGWLTGPDRLTVRRNKAATPLFLREGALIPFQPGLRRDNRCHLNDIGLLCCIPIDFSQTAAYQYISDDGISMAYQDGKRTVTAVEAAVSRRTLHLRLHSRRNGFGQVRITPYTFTRFRSCILEQDGARRILQAEPERLQFTGGALMGYRWR
jgi:alpha-glucosidase